MRIDKSTSRRDMTGPALFYHNDTWFSVCSTGFTDIAARIMCQEMGYADGRAICCGAYGYSRWPTINYTMEVSPAANNTSENV